MDKTQRERFDEINREREEFSKQWQERMKNPVFAKSYDLQAEAWSCFFSKNNYNPDRAIKLIIQAASMNPLYENHVQGMKDMIDRKKRVGKVNFKKTLNEMFFPILVKHGFELFRHPENKKWVGGYFKKSINNVEYSIIVGRSTFGHELKIVIIKECDNCKSESFDFSSCGMSDKDFEYLNQIEFNAVINKLTHVFHNNVIPWLEIKPQPAAPPDRSPLGCSG